MGCSDAGRWTNWTSRMLDKLGKLDALRTCRPELDLLWSVTTVHTQVARQHLLKQQQEEGGIKKETRTRAEYSMRRPPASSRPIGVFTAMRVITTCLLIGVVAGNHPGNLRSTSRPPRTTPPPQTASPNVFDFDSLPLEGSDASGSRYDQLVREQAEAFAAEGNRFTFSDLASFDNTATISSEEVATTKPSPTLAPTLEPVKPIYYDVNKAPTPAPTTPAPTPRDVGSSSPSSTAPSPVASTRRPTAQPTSTSPPAPTTPSTPSTPPTPRTTQTSTTIFTRSPAGPATAAIPIPTVVYTTRPVFTSRPSRAATFVPESTTTLPSTSEPTTARSADGGSSPTTDAPWSATPQANKGSNLTSIKSKWSLMIIVGSITTVAVVAALLIWRDTRRIKRRASVSETLPAPSKNTSCELDFDWYPPSPSLTSDHHSVDTFMGRPPPRKESEAHVSSRAASTGDLLNVSSVGDRSTRSDPSSRSQTIHEHEEDGDSSPSLSDGNSSLNNGANSQASRSDRTSSDPPVSFDEDVNALSDSDWEGSDCERGRIDSASSDIDTDTSVEKIFDQHRRAFLQAQGMGTPDDRASNLLATWTSSLPRTYALSAHRNTTSSPIDFRNEFKFEEEESKSDEGRDSCGSANSAVPAILEGGSVMMSSFHSDWSTSTAVGGDDDEALGSDRSIGTYDEEL